MRDAVIEVLTNPETADALSAFSRSYVVENYDIKMGARKIEALYEALQKSNKAMRLRSRLLDIVSTSMCIFSLYRITALRKLRLSLN
jgi:hypothetical protein